MNQAKRSLFTADEMLMSAIDKGWDEDAAPAAPAPTPKKPALVRRDTDRHLNIADIFTVLGDTPYARQMRERAPKKPPVARVPFTLDPTPRRTEAKGTEYRVFPNEEETPFLLTVRKGLRRRDDPVVAK
jgi:hypothetical protein